MTLLLSALLQNQLINSRVLAQDVSATDSGHHVIGVRALGVSAMHPNGHVTGWGGVGALYEVAVVGHILEVEVTASALGGDGAVSIPVDALLKVGWEPAPDVQLHIGAGPMMNVIIGAGAGVFWGAISTADVYLWCTPKLGLLAEVNYALNWEHGQFVREVEGGVGVAWRF